MAIDENSDKNNSPKHKTLIIAIMYRKTIINHFYLFLLVLDQSEHLIWTLYLHVAVKDNVCSD